MTPGTHVKVVNSYDATCNYIQPHKGHVLNFGKCCQNHTGIPHGSFIFWGAWSPTKNFKIPKKVHTKSIVAALYRESSVYILYFQERLGNPSILRSQIIMGNVRKQTSENVPVSLLRSVDLPTDGKPTNPTRESPLLVTSNPSPAPPPLEDGGAKISRRNFANLAYTKTNWKF